MLRLVMGDKYDLVQVMNPVELTASGFVSIR
jgi:hypothetical protein